MRFNPLKGAVLTTALLVLNSCGSDVASQQATQPEVKPLTAAEESAIKNEYAALPQGVMVRVAVDESGKELGDSAEIRAINENAVSTSSDASQLWSAGSAANELDQDSSTQSYGAEQVEYRDLNDSYNRGNQHNQGGYDHNRHNRGGNNQYDHNRHNRGGNDQYDNNRHNRGGNGYYDHNRHGRGHYNGGGFARGYRRGYRDGFQDGYYTDSYRPTYYSSAYYGGYWGYNSNPYCYTVGSYRYYYYQRPSCSVYSWCVQNYY